MWKEARVYICNNCGKEKISYTKFLPFDAKYDFPQNWTGGYFPFDKTLCEECSKENK